MRHEKIFKRPSGKRVKVHVSISTGFYNDEFKWEWFILICEPRKRSWHSCIDSNSYEYRKLKMEERDKFSQQQYLEHVTPEEVLETKLELWQKIKPE